MTSSARRRRERLIEAAQGYLALDMPDHAIAEIESIDDPAQCPFACSQVRGEALRQKNEFGKALDAYNRALAEEPTDISILMGMAWCYKRTDQLPRAIEAMEQAYRHNSEEPIILYNLACYYSLAQEKELALSWLGRALRMESSLRELIDDETDFDPLRKDPDFQLVAGRSAESR